MRLIISFSFCWLCFGFLRFVILCFIGPPNGKFFCDLLSEAIYIMPVQRNWNPQIPQPGGRLKMTMLSEWPGEAIPNDIKSHFIEIDVTKIPSNFLPIKEMVKDHFMNIACKMCRTELH